MMEVVLVTFVHEHVDLDVPPNALSPSWASRMSMG